MKMHEDGINSKTISKSFVSHMYMGILSNLSTDSYSIKNYHNATRNAYKIYIYKNGNIINNNNTDP